MKIVVIGKKNHLNWDVHVKNAFIGLGHEVIHLQINNGPWYIQFLRVILKGILGKNKGKKISNNFLIIFLKKKLERYDPDLIFFTSASFIPLEFYEVASKTTSNSKVFAWEGDGGISNLENIKNNDYIDVFFDSQSEYVKRNILNFSQIFHLPFCVDPTVYKNNFLKRENKLYFCGAFTKERDFIFSNLIDFDIVLRGWKWHKLSRKSKKFDIEEKTVDMQTLVSDYNKYNAVLNIHQTANAHFNSDLNMRAFEVPSCGALLINDYREGIEEYFDIENEICVYKNIDELKEILEKLKKHPEAFDKIRENGYKRVLREHTYEHRMQKVIDIYEKL